MLGRQDYHAYISSAEWANRRLQALEDAAECCEFCGDDYASLHAHHLHYRSLGSERWEDLIVLCEHCHADVHEFPKRRFEVLRFALARSGPRASDDPELGDYTADELWRLRDRRLAEYAQDVA